MLLFVIWTYLETDLTCKKLAKISKIERNLEIFSFDLFSINKERGSAAQWTNQQIIFEPFPWHLGDFPSIFLPIHSLHIIPCLSEATVINTMMDNPIMLALTSRVRGFLEPHPPPPTPHSPTRNYCCRRHANIVLKLFYFSKTLNMEPYTMNHWRNESKIWTKKMKPKM